MCPGSLKSQLHPVVHQPQHGSWARGGVVLSALRCAASPPALGQIWVPQYKKDIQLVGRDQRRATELGKWLRCAKPRAEELRRGLMAAAAPHRERRAALSSALCDSDRARGNGMELCQERVRERFFIRGWLDTGTGCSGQWSQH